MNTRVIFQTESNSYCHYNLYFLIKIRLLHDLCLPLNLNWIKTEPFECNQHQRAITLKNVNYPLDLHRLKMLSLIEFGFTRIATIKNAITHTKIMGMPKTILE